jgi:L-fucose isomerase-like protein
MNKIFIFILIGIIAILLVVIAFIVVIKTKQKKVVKKVVKKEIIDFEDLFERVKNQNLSDKELFELLKLFNENFRIDKNNAQKCLIFLSRVLTHKSKNKDLFQYFHKEVKIKNTSFKKELESIEMKALN